MPANGALHGPARHFTAALRANFLFVLKLDLAFQIAMREQRAAKIHDNAVGLDHAGIKGRVNGAQAPPDHLQHSGFKRARPQQNDAGHRLRVVPFGQHRHIDQDLDIAFVEAGEGGGALMIRHLAGHSGRTHAFGRKCLANVPGMLHRGAEHNGPALPGQFPPFAHHGRVVHIHVQHVGGLGKVILAAAHLAQMLQFLVHALQGANKSARLDQKAQGDQRV